jgi:hypothetical protein
MTAPYSICHPCPWRCWHCPELKLSSSKIIAAASKDHRCPWSHNLARYTVLALVARNAPLGSTASPSAHTHALRRRRALTYETIGAVPPWTREQWRSATKASKRRPSTRCERKPKAKAKAKAKAPLDLPALRLFRVASRVKVPPLAVGGADSIIHADNHNK